MAGLVPNQLFSTKKNTGGYRARRRWPTAQREGGNDSELAKAAIKSTRRPQNTEQTAPAPPPSPTPAAVTAPKGPWAHHHRNRHRCRFRRRQRWSAAVRRSSAPASCARLLCAQTFPRRLAALESEAARCHHPHRHCRRQASRGLLPFPPSVASFASSPPAESANKAGKKGCGGRETTPTAAPTAAQTPALPLPTRPIEPSLYPTVDFSAMDGWSSRVGPVGSDDVAVFR